MSGRNSIGSFAVNANAVHGPGTGSARSGLPRPFQQKFPAIAEMIRFVAIKGKSRLFGDLLCSPAIAAEQVKVRVQIESDHLDELRDGFRIPMGRVPVVNEQTLAFRANQLVNR